ncbi:MAG: hypothetical protein H6744_00435 [Deltaproteobacteria bacterium]|nr:hypothetical protein [Deltaproteobacteria bacterium]MCB9785132.1 hypothetical protein [Deltaproteobacteria bacterium]
MGLDARQLNLWRLGIAAWLALETVLMAAMTASEGGLYKSWLDAPGTIGAITTRPWLIWLIAAVALGGIVDFARRRDGLLGGIIYLVAMAVLDRGFAAAHGTFGLRFYFSGLLLLGWIVGRIAARVLGLDPRRSPAERLEVERFAATAALALFTTAYVNACASKLLAPDLTWHDADHLRLVILSRMMPEGTLSHALQAFLVSHPNAVRFLNVYTLIIEGGAPLLLLGPRIRMVWGTLLLSFHLGVYLSLQIFWGSAIYLVTLLGFPWHRLPWLSARLGPAPAPLTAAPAASRARPLLVFAPLALALLALWLVPIEPLRNPVDTNPADGSTGMQLGARTDRVGPLHAGLPMSAGWQVETLHVTHDAIYAELRAGNTRHVTMGMALASNPSYGSLRDIGDLAIWYQPTDTAPEDFAPAVDALAAFLQTLAPEGQSVAAALQSAAQADGFDIELLQGAP